MAAAQSSENIRERVRVVTYNVLSSKLARPDHFVATDPAHLKAESRLIRIREMIEEQLDAELGTIFCLQEISREWAPELHVFFESIGYSSLVAPYGHFFNGFMGVLIAYPRNLYELVEAKLEKISDSRKLLKRKQPPPGQLTSRSGDSLSSNLLGRLFDRLARASAAFRHELLRPAVTSAPPHENGWIYARKRYNVAILARFRRKTAGSGQPSSTASSAAPFWLATYHMPCAYWSETVMAIHAALLANRLSTLAKDEPYILVGDFNVSPSSSVYNLLTKGELFESTVLENIPSDEEPADGTESAWRPSVSNPMDSAYAVINQREPEFTNFATTKDTTDFIETLDYIFLSKGAWRVVDALELPSRSDVGGPLPNAAQPSDHLLLGATLERL